MLFPTTIKTTRKRTIKLRPRTCVDQGRWVWPLPGYDDARPCIVGRANDSRQAVELGYATPPMTAGDLVPVYAVNDGTIQLARKTASGFAMVVDHGEWSTYYAHLSRMICSPTWDETRAKVRVCAGSLLGFTTPDAPIRFELWRWTQDAGFVPTAPEQQMNNWIVLRERDPQPQPATMVAA